jgi:CheY-like chemotaxis protein
MPANQKILLLDDDPDLLELYSEILGRLPSKPDIFTATSGARAIALLEAQSFTLLICDLNMPKMDGLQVLAIVRRKFPHLRTAVLTAVMDEQFRARAYAIGVDIFFEKPSSPQEIQLFLDCVESLLGQDVIGSFRGVQSKSLVDIIQLECLSQSSSVLRVINEVREGRIWFQDGEVIDAAVSDLTGEAAFQFILSWRTGNFEILAPEPGHPRTIFTSPQALLLESAQALDEAKAQEPVNAPNGTETGPTGVPFSSLAEISRFKGVEFALALRSPENEPESWGLNNPEQLAQWTRSTLQSFRKLGEELRAGDLGDIEGIGLQLHVGIASQGPKDLCVGFQRTLSADQIRESMKNILAEWIS